MHAVHLTLFLGLAVSTAQVPAARAPAEDQFIIVPLRVHVLSSPDLDLANCRLSDAAVRGVIADLNAIWHPAGIRFDLESLLREPAAQRERFRLLTEKRERMFGFPEVSLLLPGASRDFDGLHAYVFHELPYNSTFLGDDAVVVMEEARVMQVQNGCGNAIARVMAHALGRALAVPNSGDERSLMANGTSGAALDAREAELARQVARMIPGAATVAESRRRAEASKARGEASDAPPPPALLAGQRPSTAVKAEARKPAAQPAEEAVPAKDQFLVVPLRAHVLTASDLELANCRLTDADVARVLDHVNAIWHRAHIHFGLETLCREPAGEPVRFRIATNGQRGGFAWPERMLIPRSTRTFDGLHAYYFHTLPMNGGYLGGDAVLVQEGAQVCPVKGGTDDPVARVTAHALGSALGLPDDPDPMNLMSQGASGVALDDVQVDFARSVARTLHGVATAAELRKAAVAAQANGERVEARRLWSWLAEVPGPGAVEAETAARGIILTG